MNQIRTNALTVAAVNVKMIVVTAVAVMDVIAVDVIAMDVTLVDVNFDFSVSSVSAVAVCSALLGNENERNDQLSIYNQNTEVARVVDLIAPR